jgi:2-oxo-3-hexenedioate decarboxylase
MPLSADTVAALATELLHARAGARLAPLPSARHADITLDDGFAVGVEAARRRAEAGELVRGYKIGFTNRTIWPRYGVFAPIWGPVWNTTLERLATPAATVSLGTFSQPRLEPEIVFGLKRTPEPGLSPEALVGCIDWVAHGFEIVHSHHADWKFAAADCEADFALHGRLFVGPTVPIAALGTPAEAVAALAALRVELQLDGRTVDTGTGANVLDGPVQALKAWVDEMPRRTPAWRIEPGHVVTTGTITDAAPMGPGQRWTTVLSDPRLHGLALATHG